MDAKELSGRFFFRLQVKGDVVVDNTVIKAKAVSICCPHFSQNSSSTLGV